MPRAPQHIALGALFLATKVEESPRKMRDVLAVFMHLEQKRKGLKPQPLAGAGTLITLSPQVQERIAFYRDLSMAFEGALTN